MGSSCRGGTFSGRNMLTHNETKTPKANDSATTTGLTYTPLYRTIQKSTSPVRAITGENPEDAGNGWLKRRTRAPVYRTLHTRSKKFSRARGGTAQHFNEPATAVRTEVARVTSRAFESSGQGMCVYVWGEVDGNRAESTNTFSAVLGKAESKKLG